MSEAADSFKDIAVPEGSDRRELYKSPYRAIYTYKMSAQELDEKFREAITGDHQKGGWQIKNDERVKYVGKLEVSKEVCEDGDPSNKKKLDYKARPRSLRALAQSPPPCPRRLPESLAPARWPTALRRPTLGRAIPERAPHGACRRRALATLAPPLRGSSSRVQSWPPPRAQVSFEDYPEAGMSALKYYTIQSYTK